MIFDIESPDRQRDETLSSRDDGRSRHRVRRLRALGRAAKLIGLALGVVVLLLGGSFALIESGEVIVLRELSEDGHGLIARLWVVDHEGDAWIGKADPSRAKWVARLRSDPRVEFCRAGVCECRSAVAVKDPATRREVYSLFQSKYRIPLYGSRLIGLLLGSNPDLAQAERSGVLFRLDRCPPDS